MFTSRVAVASSLCIAVIVLMAAFSARSALSNNTNIVQVSDPAYFFSAGIPADWKVTHSKNPTSFLRVSAKSSTGDSSVSFYAIRRPGVIELEKFAGMDSQLFKNLGSMTDTRNIREYLLFTKAIEKAYGKNIQGLHALARFESHGSYAYVLLAAGGSSDFSAAKNIFETFQVHIPDQLNLKNMFTLEGVVGGVIALLGVDDDLNAPLVGAFVIALIPFLGVGVLYLLGKSGQLVRKGVELKKALKRVKRDATQKGLQINNNVWHRYNRKATWFIFAPLLGWGVVYSFLTVALPLKLLFFSLIALVVPLLGYFGIFFVPSDDAADYVPKGL